MDKNGEKAHEVRDEVLAALYCLYSLFLILLILFLAILDGG